MSRSVFDVQAVGNRWIGRGFLVMYRDPKTCIFHFEECTKNINIRIIEV